MVETGGELRQLHCCSLGLLPRLGQTPGLGSACVDTHSQTVTRKYFRCSFYNKSGPAMSRSQGGMLSAHRWRQRLAAGCGTLWRASARLVLESSVWQVG